MDQPCQIHGSWQTKKRETKLTNSSNNWKQINSSVVNKSDWESLARFKVISNKGNLKRFSQQRNVDSKSFSTLHGSVIKCVYFYTVILTATIIKLFLIVSASPRLLINTRRDAPLTAQIRQLCLLILSIFSSFREASRFSRQLRWDPMFVG